MITSFKYRSGPAALRSLSEGTAYFASPVELNDSLEAKFELASTSHFIDVVTNTFNELSIKRGQPSYSFDQTGFSAIDSTNRVDNQKFQEASRKMGIFSTAARPDNQPMWAYYCGNSAGVCFELEWSEEFLSKHQLWPFQVSYTTEARVHNRADDLRVALLELDAQHPDWTIAELQEFSLTESFRKKWGIQSMARAVSSKHADWKHESELRILSAHSGPKWIMQDILKRVYFIRTDFPEWGAIIMLLHRLYPRVEIAQVIFDHKDPYVTVKHLEATLIPTGRGAYP